MNLKPIIFASTLLAGCGGDLIPDRISIPVRSHHFKERHPEGGAPFNNNTPGGFVTFEGLRTDISFGAFKNSYHNTTIAAFAGYDFVRKPEWALGVVAGTANYPERGDSGYMPWPNTTLIPMAGLRARYGNVQLLHIPNDGETSTGTTAIAFTIEADKLWK